MWKLVFMLLFFTLQTCASAISTPVLMIDHDNVMSRLTHVPNPFAKIDSEFFTEIVIDALKRTACVVIFVEDQLSIEALSSRDRLGTPFYYLQQGILDKRVIYMPSVAHPYELLQQVFPPHVSNIFHLGSGEKLHVLEEHKYLYVYFQDDSHMNSPDRLRKHDVLMKDIYFSVRQMKGAPIVAFYTGITNPVTGLGFERRFSSVKGRPGDEKGVMITTPDALFRLTGVFATTHSRRSSFDQTPVVEVELRTRRTLSTTMRYSDFHLRFDFVFGDKKWSLASVALLEAGEEVGRTVTGIEVPWYRSYYCIEPITIINMRDGSSVTVSEYQIEPIHPSRRSISSDQLKHLADGQLAALRASANCSFSPSVNCGPYFNTVILSGLLVVALFVLISGWGVLMLFNCGTSDRCDDPNQKPLVIAAEHGGH